MNIFMSRFKGREDVFARRWQKWDNSVSGYSPVYTDSRRFSYEPFTARWAEKHLLGNSVLGVYPLLQDNTSWFIAADFDGEQWKDSVSNFHAVCKKHGLTAAVERSRSGNGAHAWLFFEQPYPASKSRKIFTALLRESGAIGEFEKNESFDRLFPNQDYHSGKGLGNLIALPLQGNSRKDGNTVFIDPEDGFKIIDDQWSFLNKVHLTTPQELDSIYDQLNQQGYSASSQKKRKSKRQAHKGLITLTISGMIDIDKQELLPSLTTFLREELNLLNIEFVVRERAGLPTYGSPRFINTILSNDEIVSIPRGFLDQLTKWLDDHKIHYVISDETIMRDPIKLNLKTDMFPFQQDAVESFEKQSQGILISPAGSGKTIMGLALIAQKMQPAIILTHRRQIYDQWLDRIESTLGIPRTKIGQLCSTKKEITLPIIVAMVQTLGRLSSLNGIADRFGTIIVDECHHMPAKMFRDVVSKFSGKYLFGLTATPDRKYNDQKLISAYLGPIIHIVKKEDIVVKTTDSESDTLRDIVIVRNTNIEIPFGNSPRNFPLISKIISNDSYRNSVIVIDVAAEARNGQKCLVLTERKEHVDMLKAYLSKDFEVIAFSGDLSARQRKFSLQKIKSGRFNILIATGQIFGEGTDIDSLDILFLTFPVSFRGKLAQYIGRIKRGGGDKKIYDYRDIKVPILEKMWKKRESYYRNNDFDIKDDPTASLL